MTSRIAVVVAVCLCLGVAGIGPGGPLSTAAEPGDSAASESIEPNGDADVEIDAQVANASGETTVVVRLANRPERKAAATTEAQVDSLRSHAAESRSAFERFAAGNPHVEIDRRFWVANALVVTVDADRIPLERLGTVENVTAVHEDFEVELDRGVAPRTADSSASPAVAAPSTTAPTAAAATATAATTNETATTAGLEQIRAPDAWDAFGTRGEGATVAVLDTGVDADHPDIEVAGWKDFNDSPSDAPKDYGDHGTHVSGTVVGANASGTHIGVAPEADLLHGAVLTDCGSYGCSGTFSDIVDGMEWAIENDADVISMSLGLEGYYSYFIDPVRNAERAGVLVVSSSGNDGAGTSGSPGNVYETMSIGATTTGADEKVSHFSSGEVVNTTDDWGDDAPDDWPNEYVVPNVVAPGVDVYSAVPGGYGEKDGTSMAAPHVAGSAALLLSDADDDLSPAEIRDRFASTAVDLNESAHRQGDGRIDVYETLYEYSWETLDPTIAPTRANVSTPTTITVDVDHPVEEYRWTFANGTTATTTEPSVEHTFEELGTTNVSLTLVDSRNETTVSRELEVVDEVRPTATFDAPAEPIVNATVAFDASESSDNYGIDRYEWTFGTDAEPVETTEPELAREFGAVGEREVTLTVVDRLNNTDSTTANVSVRDPPAVSVSEPVDGGIVATDTVSVEYTLENTDLANASGLEYRVRNSSGESLSNWTEAPFEATAEPRTANVSVANLSDGERTIELRLIDDEGSEIPFDDATAERTVTVDTAPPSVAVAELAGATERDGEVFLDGDGNLTVVVDADSGGQAGATTPVTDVTVTLESLATIYRHTVLAEQDPDNETRWTASVPAGALPDEERYRVRATATDGAENANETTADAPIAYDRTAPRLSAVVSDLETENGTATAAVRVRSSEPLRDAPDLAVTGPDGSDVALEPLVADANDTTSWTTAFETDESGRYELTASGVDLAGNRGDDAATATVRSVDADARTVTVPVDGSDGDAFVTFEPADDESARVAITASSTAPRTLPPELGGATFLTTALADADDTRELRSNATVGVPVDRGRLPDSVAADDDRVRLREYDAAGERWAQSGPLTVRELEGSGDESNDSIDGRYWTASLEELAADTGVTVRDDGPPELANATPEAGATLGNDAETATIDLEYADDLAGVNVSSIALFVDGEPVTDPERLSITSNRTVYDGLPVEAGESYAIELDVADRAGNATRLETTFDVSADGEDDGGSGGGISFPSPPAPDEEPDRPEPTAAIAVEPNPALVGEEITLSGSESTDEERAIIRYEWVIDGAAATGETVATSFDEPGTYEIELTVTNDFAESDTTTATVTVDESEDEADDAAANETNESTGRNESAPSTDASTEDGDDSVPGFGALVALGTLLAVAVRLRRGA